MSDLIRRLSGSVPDMSQHVQQPFSEPDLQMPQYNSQQLNKEITYGAPSVARQNATGQQNYQAMMNARQQAYQQEMARRRGM